MKLLDRRLGGPAALGLLAALLVAQGFLFTVPVHSAATYDEGVYLAAVDALRHGQALGSQVFAAQFPGFYELLRGLSYLTGIGVAAIRFGFVGVTLLGSVGAFLVGRRFGGAIGGLAAVAFLTIAPPLDLFGYQVIADTPALALSVLAIGVATLPGTAAAVLAGACFGAALSVKLSALTVAPTLVWMLRRRLPQSFAGCVAVVAIVVLSHAGALGTLWASGVTYHEKARSTPAVMPHPHRQIIHQIPHTTPFYWLAILAAVTGVAFLARRAPLRVWPLWLWVVLSVVFLLVQKPLHDNHLINFPFALAVAAAATIAAALQRLPLRPRAAAAVLLALAVAAGYVQQWHRVQLAKVPEPASNVAAAHELRRITPPNAIVVDDRAIISFLARRRVYGPLVDIALLRFETGSLDDADVIRGLAHADAAVVSRSLRARPAVLRYLHARFAQRYDAGGVRIFVRRRRA